MPKVRRLNKFSSEASSSPLVSFHRPPPTKTGLCSSSSLSSTTIVEKDEKESSETQPLSRGQKRRMLKHKRHLKREEMILSSLRLKKQDDQRGKLDGMDAIKEALSQTIQRNREISRQKSPSSAAEVTGDLLTKSNKDKRNVAQTEIPHLNLVLQHPSFQANPFATMQEHLRNSVKEQKNCLQMQADKQRQDDQKKIQDKKEEKKERIRDLKYRKGTRKYYNKRKT